VAQGRAVDRRGNRISIREEPSFFERLFR